MRNWLAQPRADKPGCHVYGDEQWGLDPDHIRKLYAHYIDHFDVAYPGRPSRRPAEAAPAAPRFPRQGSDQPLPLASHVARPS